MRKVEIAPSILSADFSRLGEEIREVEAYSGRIHIDVMDGHFVPNLTMGPVVVRSIRPVTKLPLEVHLMVTDPIKFVEPFAEAGADRLIFHVEVGDTERVAGAVGEAGCAAGLALNPETRWDGTERFMSAFDLVTIMTVSPGFGGQEFREDVLPKIAAARGSLTESGLDVDIEVDGGIDSNTAQRAGQAGANVFVAGQAIFGLQDAAAAARELAVAVGARRDG